jgi:hypothetical protein
MRRLAAFPALLPLAAVASLAFAGSFTACSSKQGTIVGGEDGGIRGTPQDQPDGGLVSYPTAHIGIAQRGLVKGVPGTTPGQVIQDFKFLGYPNADITKGLQTVSLSDYYDPSATKYKVLHIIAAAKWCTDCLNEMSALTTAFASPSTDYADLGVAYLGALVEGDTINIGATPTDLNAWIGEEKTTFTWVLDPEASQLGAFFQAAAVPFNADIDVRSMEILQAGVGQEAPSNVQVWLDWVSKNPPSYAAP